MGENEPPGVDGVLAVDIRSVSKAFGAVVALQDVTVTVPVGSVVALIGPSGSGKSTLLRCINNLETIDSGDIQIHGQAVGIGKSGRRGGKQSDRDAAKQRSQVGMVFQSFNLFGHMTAIDNVMSGLVHVRRIRRNEARIRARTVLARVGLQDKEDSYPSHLSGGQQQRVAIARALAMEPSVMLFDEPTSALDPEMISEVLEVIRDVASAGMTLMIATHEMGFAREVSDHVVFMDGGRIVEQNMPNELFHKPKTERCQLFLAKILGAGRALGDVGQDGP